MKLRGPLTTADLAEAYIEHLEEMLRPPVEQHVNRRSIKQLLALTRRHGAELYNESGPTWIWSDLHLHHANIVEYCQRPFSGVEAMDEALTRAWSDTVGPGDNILCGGDLAMAGSLWPERLRRIRHLPGRKHIVVGNHDVDRKGEVADTGSDRQAMALLIKGAPQLLVTHLPLEAVPAGSVNVHGHVHNNVPLGRGRHINVCVEQTGYRPLPLSCVRALAYELAAGRVPPGETTIERIEAVLGRPLAGRTKGGGGGTPQTPVRGSMGSGNRLNLAR